MSLHIVTPLLLDPSAGKASCNPRVAARPHGRIDDGLTPLIVPPYPLMSRNNARKPNIHNVLCVPGDHRC
jgi:hypothetical protein